MGFFSLKVVAMESFESEKNDKIVLITSGVLLLSSIIGIIYII